MATLSLSTKLNLSTVTIIGHGHRCTAAGYSVMLQFVTPIHTQITNSESVAHPIIPITHLITFGTIAIRYYISYHTPHTSWLHDQHYLHCAHPSALEQGKHRLPQLLPFERSEQPRSYELVTRLCPRHRYHHSRNLSVSTQPTRRLLSTHHYTITDSTSPHVYRNTFSNSRFTRMN